MAVPALAGAGVKARTVVIPMVLLLMLTSSAWAAQRSFLIIVSGIGGEVSYSEKFSKWSKTMISAAQSRTVI